MQNTTTSLRKWSDLKGLAVVAIDSGNKEGTLDDFYFDPATNEVKAFRIKTGLFGHRVLLTQSITAIGVDALTCADNSLLIKENETPELSTLPLGSVLHSYRVLSEGGNIVGTIGNLYLNITLPNHILITAYELSGGVRERISGKYLSFSSEQVLRYGHDVIVIPNDVAHKLSELL